MTNPKTGKPQLADYEHKGVKKKKLTPDIINEDISSLPDKEELKEKTKSEDQRTELDGILKPRR